MVDFLLVHRTAEMLVQRTQTREPPHAEIASIAGPIPCCVRGRRSGVIAAMVRDQLVREDMVTVDLAAVLVDLVTVDPRRAATVFKVEGDAREVGEFVGAPGAFDGLADVDGGFEVLRCVNKWRRYLLCYAPDSNYSRD